MQGEGGFYVAPLEFITGLKALADRYGILLIADEVQTGAGRTGTWFACEQWPVAPDLITTAKSLAGGFPLSGVVGRADVIDAPAAGGLGGTYAGSPVACAAALAVIEAFEKEHLLARSQDMGALLVRSLKDMAAKVPAIGDVRGLGAMVAIELFENGDPHRPDAALTKKVVTEAAKRGLKPLAKIVAHATQSQDPSEFTIAPIGAMTNLLKKAGWDKNDVDLFEINEAFAMVTMLAMREHGLDHAKVNVYGGACAQGHPVGSTGSRIIVTLINALQRTGGKRGVASLCIGGGEATAVAIELI